MRILNTRPAHQSENLTRLIEKSGGGVFHLPLLKILSVSFYPIKIDDFDYIIFLSANAVNYFFKKNKLLFCEKKIIAIGSATKNALAKLELNNIICPDDFNSEGILKIPELQHCKNKSIVIISGENPKPLLAKELSKRGAILKNIFCYCRKPIQYNMKKVFSTLLENKINTIIVTSYESFLHLLGLFKKPDHRAWLLQKKLCVVNEKMKNAALEAGFHTIIQAKNATDEEIARKVWVRA